MKFIDNYLEELPIDVQIKIMDIVVIERKNELKIVYEINKKINNMGFYIENDEEDICFAILSEDILTILNNLKDMDLKFDHEFYCEKLRLISECSNDNNSMKAIIKAVNNYGIFKAIKLGIEKEGNDTFNNTEITTLYKKCYFHILYNTFDFTYEDIKLIKDYDILII
jgi:hypothetical protein